MDRTTSRMNILATIGSTPLAGTSSGANMVAALRVARHLGPGATVAMIMIDSGLRYLLTDVFRSATGK